jgi:hypothetical protein
VTAGAVSLAGCSGSDDQPDPETLDAGTYDLTIELPILDTESTRQWAGNECPTKAIDIELRTNGFRIQDSLSRALRARARRLHTSPAPILTYVT